MKLYARVASRDVQYASIIGDSEGEERDNGVSEYYREPSIAFDAEFSPFYSLDEGEWFYVTLDDEKKQELLEGYLGVRDSPSSVNPILQGDYDSVDCLFGVEGDKIIFTKITPKYIVRNKIFVIQSADMRQAKIEKRSRAIDFDPNKVDAYYNGGDRLYFRNYKTVNSLFKGLSQFYRDAGEGEINDFLNLELFDVDHDRVNVATIKGSAVKKIATIADEDDLNPSDDNCIQHSLNVIRQFGEDNIGLSLRENKILLLEPKHVSIACDVLLGNYFISPITQTKRRTAGSIKIGRS